MAYVVGDVLAPGGRSAALLLLLLFVPRDFGEDVEDVELGERCRRMSRSVAKLSRDCMTRKLKVGAGARAMMPRMLRDFMTRKLKVGAGAQAIIPRILVRSRFRRTVLHRCFVIGIDGDVDGDDIWAVHCRWLVILMEV